MVPFCSATYTRATQLDGANVFGHQHWVQMKSDVEDPDLTRPGGFARQVRARLLGSSILLVVLIFALVLLRLN